MDTDYFEYMDFVRIYVLITFVVALITLDKSKLNNKLLIAVLFVLAITEISSTLLSYNNVSIGLLYKFSFILHNTLWLYILKLNFNNPKSIAVGILLFLVFSVVNIVRVTEEFDYGIFICGAFIYLSLFIYHSFVELKKENVQFFTTNNYLLLCTPIILFVGLSFIFGFKSKNLAQTVVYGNTRLYYFIGYFANSIYYTLINIYIYISKKVQYAK